MPLTDPLPDHMFHRQDDSADEAFYSTPRMVNHIDDATINEITRFYREALAPEDELLDLMSSWVSHLPQDVTYRKVTGLGMNLDELNANVFLDQVLVHNLNKTPALPFPDASFNAVMIVVSIQYLTRPFEVFKEIQRVLKTGGRCIVAMSHRLFPTKAIYAFQTLAPQDRVQLVKEYMRQSGLSEIEFIDRSPENADPLWIIQGINS
ncbi:MAG: methyltransferase domain-containing protein [Gammaproteobacteria bacterium]|jgi:SAM-dependent methyltransferase|nr:methyltransferase domain-containing protein [Gammaproteobacteria bacterium]